MAANGDFHLETYVEGWMDGFQDSRESMFCSSPPSPPSPPSTLPPDSKKDKKNKKDEKSKKDKKDKKGKTDTKTVKKSKKSKNDKKNKKDKKGKKDKTNEKDIPDQEDLEHLLTTFANRTQSEEQALEDEILKERKEDDQAYENRVAQGLYEPAR